MQTEDRVPADQRFLWLDGVVSKSSLELVAAGLPPTWPSTAMCFFVGFAYADLPIGKSFEFAFPFGRPEQAVPTTAIVRAITQQWGKPLNGVPCGWKTVCVVDFPTGVPAIVANLPTVDAWYTLRDERVCLSGKEAVDALLENRG